MNIRPEYVSPQPLFSQWRDYSLVPGMTHTDCFCGMLKTYWSFADTLPTCGSKSSHLSPGRRCCRKRTLEAPCEREGCSHLFFAQSETDMPVPAQEVEMEDMSQLHGVGEITSKTTDLSSGTYASRGDELSLKFKRRQAVGKLCLPLMNFSWNKGKKV